MTATYRMATRNDVSQILTFIQDLAEHEESLHEVKATEQQLAQSLFGENPRAYAMMAEVEGKPAGFAIYFFNFSTWTAKPGLYLEDLYVAPQFRSLGIARAFFRLLAQEALRNGCARFEWWVLDSNEIAVNYYRKMGAEAMVDWTVQRLSLEQMEALTV